jgi:phosphoribosyl-AMP cyclohydrolase
MPSPRRATSSAGSPRADPWGAAGWVGQNVPVDFTDSALDPELARRLRPAGHAPDGRPLVTAVTQDAESGRVLMVAWMDAEALLQTLTTRIATYYSRSRQEIWVKGLTSGATQHVVDLALDCDGDALLLRVHPDGPACHTGLASCFDTLEIA